MRDRFSDWSVGDMQKMVTYVVGVLNGDGINCGYSFSEDGEVLFKELCECDYAPSGDDLIVCVWFVFMAALRASFGQLGVIVVDDDHDESVESFN